MSNTFLSSPDKFIRVYSFGMKIPIETLQNYKVGFIFLGDRQSNEMYKPVIMIVACYVCLSRVGEYCLKFVITIEKLWRVHHSLGDLLLVFPDYCPHSRIKRSNVNKLL